MTEPLGPPEETCRECHSPLSTDQRYCLACGARRGDTRVPLPGARPVAAAPVAAAPRWSANTAAVAGVATLVLAMGVGVLIGRAGRDDAAALPAAAARPQVIRVGGGAAAAAPAAAGTATARRRTSSASARKAKRHKRRSSAISHPTKATNPALKKLSKVSAKDYSKQSKKLPKTLGTGGKAPPKDHKKPAGGGGFEDIG